MAKQFGGRYQGGSASLGKKRRFNILNAEVDGVEATGATGLELLSTKLIEDKDKAIELTDPKPVNPRMVEAGEAYEKAIAPPRDTITDIGEASAETLAGLEADALNQDSIPFDVNTLTKDQFEQHQRERTASLGEKLGTKDLSSAAFQDEAPLQASLLRGENLGALLPKITSLNMYQQESIADVGFESGLEKGDPNNPTRSGGRLNVNAQSVFLDPTIMDAGEMNPDGRIRIDPKLGVIMSLTMENYLYNEVLAAPPDADVSNDIAEGDADNDLFGKTISKSKGSNKLGREVFQAWRRQKSFINDQPTTDYLSDSQNITSETYTLIGDLTKEAYARANPTMLLRDSSKTGINKGQVDFILTVDGIAALESVNEYSKALFQRKEVPPLNAPTGRLIYEGQTYVRPMTTVMDNIVRKQIKQSVLRESINNYNSVALVSDPNREALSLMFGTQALLNHDRVDNQDGDSNYYADMYKIGQKRLLVAEKQKQVYIAELAALKADVVNLDLNKEKIIAKEAVIKSYDPKQIVAQDQEQMFNLLDSVTRYGNKENYITYSIQALTGRTHVQQTLYNPQSHKIIRSIIGSGNVYKFKPRSGSKLEDSWKDIIAARVLDLSIEEKTAYGINADATSKLTTKARLKLFEAQRSNKSSSYWTAVAYGNTLLNALDTFKSKGGVDQAKNSIRALANSSSIEESNKIKNQMFANDNFNVDPLQGQTELKKILAKHDKEAPMYADYYMDLAKYENAIKDNSQFNTTITVEIDGRTHGPATNAALIGVYDMAKRAGILRSQDTFATDLPDLRLEMGEHMKVSLDKFVGAKNSLVPLEELNTYKQLLQLAINDAPLYLKKSPMTMGYGQEIESLRGHVKEVVQTSSVSSSAIQDIISNPQNNITEEKAIEFLHTMLVDSIFEVLSNEVIAVGRTMKANALYAQMTNIPLMFTNAMGFKSVAAGTESIAKIASQYTIDGDPITVQNYEQMLSGSAIRGALGPGGFGSRIQAVAVQSYDGNMIAQTGAGQSWKRIQESVARNGGTNTFAIPIFDAFLLDLGSYEVVKEEANRNWLQSIKNHSYITSVTDEWYKETKAKFADNQDSLVSVPIDWANARDKVEGEYKGLAYLFKKNIKADGTVGKQLNLVDAIRRTQATRALGQVPERNEATGGIDIKTKAETTTQYKKRYSDIAFQTAKRIMKDIADAGIPNPAVTDTLTSKQAYEIVNIITNRLQLSGRNAAVTKRTIENKAKIMAEIKKPSANLGL